MTSLAGHRHKPARVPDRGRLAVDLTRAVRGEVRFDRGSQALYANDASVFRQVPIDASPTHAVPGPVARTAAKVAGKLHGDDHQESPSRTSPTPPSAGSSSPPGR